MKIAVLVPSEEYKNYAGARIRYGRLASKLNQRGIDLRLEDIAAFVPESSPFDVLLISKCHDARSLVHAAHAGQRGHLVGVDIFDDYFIQKSDSRLARYRNWIKQLLPICDFSLCSTLAMSRTVKSYRGDLPCHVVNDPAPEYALEVLPETLERKLREVREQRRLSLAWFGVGDNPHFQIGIHDVAAYSNVLKDIIKSGLNVRLSILTNARALDAERLSAIATLPVRTRIEEWTEEREKSLISEVFACFLPVNAQAFSAAKSLNRAITALTHGCQVISAGYPLYSAFDPLIYRDVDSFLTDVAGNSMRLSATRLDHYQEVTERYASATEEVGRLSHFLKNLKSRQHEEPRPLALIHGHATNGGAHKRVRAIGGFSVGSPFCTSELGFDVVFRGSSSSLTMLISDKAANRLECRSRSALSSSHSVGGQTYWELPSVEAPRRCSASALVAAQELPLSYQLATYGETMKCIAARMRFEFGCGRVIVSETAPYPFQFSV